MSFTPEEEASMLVQQAAIIADELLDDMDGPSCTDMVRQFCAVMADWQPNIKKDLDDPMLTGIHCLATARLFELAFVKAYAETDKRLKAEKSIRQALGGLE